MPRTILANTPYRRVSVYPSASEINRPRLLTSLPQNIIKGPYDDLDHYLGTHFTLLREDFIKPIREDLCKYLSNSEQRLTNIKIHEVHFIRKGVKRENICHCVEIKRGITYRLWNIKRDQKRFMLGSLLIFSKDNFQTVFSGRVVDAHNIIYRKMLVSFEHPVHLAYETNYLMIECNNFFEPYYQVLNVIQQIECEGFPLKKHLVDADPSVGMPNYLNKIAVKVSDPQLNLSQSVAMNAALSQELVIIQGPPGTGKTFLGLKIAKQLLAMSGKWWNQSPMLVISFTNHALDQFLEDLTGSTDQIMRFGGQSRNSKMKNYTVRECRQRYYDQHPNERHRRRLMGGVYKEFCAIEKSINTVGNQMDNLATAKPTCIFYFDVMATGVPTINLWFSGADYARLVTWLLEEDGSIQLEPLIHTAPEDRIRLTNLYNNFLKQSPTGSKYCMMSLSIMGKVLQALYDKIVEISTAVQMLKLKNPKVRLREKKRELKSLTEDYYYLLRKIKYMKHCLRTPFGMPERDRLNRADPFKMPSRVRWQLYQYWLSKYETYLKDKMEDLIQQYQPAYASFNRIQESNNLALIKHQKIIGMTTTMAARMHSVIKQVKCPIVIVEEAAEVLEAHIIPVLTEHCQHLILIGDHLQLKPTTADYEIETVHRLGVSMFERMVRNDVQCYTLNVQHRMRPEISSLVTPSIYPVLYNHDTVTKFPPIRGMKRNLYFLSHRHPEQGTGETSKKNLHEAKLLIRLARYLLQNGYQPEEITILGAYLGQVGALMLEQAQQDDEKVRRIKITSVDNFQGEENKIILLSLVRNNSNRSIGFLSIQNRVCVALSRAKEGMYVMGNMELLTDCSRLWRTIQNSLATQDAIGERLPLKCTQHDVVTLVQSPEDFEMMAPHGGCAQLCEATLPCGHLCQMVCHLDGHLSYKCNEPCPKSSCTNPNHRCPKLCYQPCGVCTTQLKEELACGHRVRCYMQVQQDFRCLETVYMRLACGHKRPVQCNEADSDFEEDLNCSMCETATPKAKNVSNDDSLLDDLEGRVGQLKIEDEDSDSDIELPQKPEDLGVFVESNVTREGVVRLR